MPLRWIDLLSEGIEPTWQQVLSQTQRRDQRASLRKLKVDPFVYANDIHSGAVELARQAARRAGVEHLIDFRCQDAEVYRPRHPPGIIVSNPPWDQRLHGAKESWHKLAAFVSSQSSATPCSHTSSGNGEAPNSDSSGGNSNEECSVAPKEVHYGVSPAQRRSRKLDLWVLSGNEQLNARYLQQAPHKRIELRTASNNFLIF